MKSEIVGSTLPVVQITLQSGETIVSEPGEFCWMSDTIRMATAARTAGAKGLLGIVKRTLGGGTLFMNEFRAEGGAGTVAFAAKLPGQIVEEQVDSDRTYMVHRHGYMCGTEDVALSVGFQKSLGAGIFGGEGLVLQKISGSGTVWIALGGDVIVHDLKPGETLQVHPGHIGMFEERVGFDMTMVRGISNALFGGDGLFVARLTGPGKVWLQSLTMPTLAHALVPYLPQPKEG
jgi:uncharacterized protein (TIGR00266 family)